MAIFKKSFSRGIAKALNISSTDVTVTDVSIVNRRDMRRSLLAQSVSVTYVVTVPVGVTAASLTSTLETAQSKGTLNQDLESSGIAGAVAAVPLVTNISPTRFPTAAPTEKNNAAGHNSVISSSVYVVIAILTVVLTLS